ncbi:MAG: phosphopantothenoylcysteine decarboxylase [Coraliomargaritaceae bacterium]
MSKTSSLRCLITAGPTQEYIDPVRFISNPSTGKMGFALAQAALEQGWSVDLVSGPVNLQEPDGAILYPVVSAESMYHQVDALFDVCDVCIMTAAVSDFTPIEFTEHKVKKDTAKRTLHLAKTIDILKTMGERKQAQFVVGFAAETDDLEANAKSKLTSKNCDWVIANKIGEEGIGFGSDNNAVTIFKKNGSSETHGPTTKLALAQTIIQAINHSLGNTPS